jgi:hemerythrin-like domain-containing protein
MKRAAELRDLSEDHHHGLVHARRLREAASGEEGDQLATARAFLDFWQRDTSAHFRKEEEVLLPILARHGRDLGQGPVVEMLAQHAQIRGLVMELSDEVTDGRARPETLRSIGERLEAHIRLEEREVFPLIEETLPEEALKEISSRLTVKEAGPRAKP